MFKKNYSEYDNVVTPTEDVEELAGFKVGEVALYNNLIVKIERIDLRSGIYLIRQDTLQRIQILSVHELTKTKAGQVLF